MTATFFYRVHSNKSKYFYQVLWKVPNCMCYILHKWQHGFAYSTITRGNMWHIFVTKEFFSSINLEIVYATYWLKPNHMTVYINCENSHQLTSERTNSLGKFQSYNALLTVVMLDPDFSPYSWISNCQLMVWFAFTYWKMSRTF